MYGQWSLQIVDFMGDYSALQSTNTQKQESYRCFA